MNSSLLLAHDCTQQCLPYRAFSFKTASVPTNTVLIALIVGMVLGTIAFAVVGYIVVARYREAEREAQYSMRNVDDDSMLSTVTWSTGLLAEEEDDERPAVGGGESETSGLLLEKASSVEGDGDFTKL